MNKHLQTLLKKEMTRKEFLTTLGLGLAAVFGFSAILRLLTGKSASQHFSHGYGSDTYGR
ncbi:MAG TPA: hypothetical protein VJP80_07805 [Candidatus Saccharimonadales bacterium]|nr:hypothetical protein [Candidatus Saccharimonadales bacterium]